ncbi:hypothetical protein FI667_g4686, partial [Globisporangium splendens]
MSQSEQQRKRGPVAPRRLTTLRKEQLIAVAHQWSVIEIFGVLGAPLLAVVGISIVRTAWLIALNVAPNDTANYLMSTGEFDNGSFWLLINPHPALLTVVCSVLALVLTAYLWVLLNIVVLIRQRNRARRRGGGDTRSSRSDGVANVSRSIVRVLFGQEDHHVIVTLLQILEAGFPAVLCYTYAALIAANCLSCVLTIWNHSRLTAFDEVLIDMVFDMLVTVVVPITLLLYSYYNFHLDRELFRIAAEVAPNGSFERQTRMVADPTQVTLFLLNCNVLRIQSGLDLCIFVGMNTSLAYRLKRVVEVKAEQHRRSAKLSSLSSQSTAETQRPVPKWMIVPFLVLGSAIITYTHLCITSSHDLCETHPSCVAFAHCVINNAHSCPCLAMIDVERAPKTYEEWENPIDVTETLASLAASGDLQVLQVINRKLVELPEELHRCKHLRHIHIEGPTGGVKSLRTLSNDLFAKMASLTFLHLGLHPALTRMPLFNGLSNLKSMTLALLLSLGKVPPVEPLTSLERLELLFLSKVTILPDLAPLVKLAHFVMLDAPACCNGVVGPCDHSRSICSSSTACPTYVAPPSVQQQKVIQRFSQTVCSMFLSDKVSFVNDASKASTDACGGVLYRKYTASASSESTPAEHATMCFNDRMNAIGCTDTPVNVAIRKLQISRNVGTPCNPVEEQWLGCKPRE